MKKFAKKIKDLRIDTDKNQTEIAEELEIKQRTYSNYEMGVTEPQMETLIKIAKLYKVSTDYLLGLTDISTPYPPPKNKIEP